MRSKDRNPKSQRPNDKQISKHKHQNPIDRTNPINPTNPTNPTNPITYCTNIHPGDGWRRILSNLQTHFLDVKRAVSPDEFFPIGLWLSNRASLEIDEKEAERFAEWCRGQGCYVATINGFPFGSFHGRPIKDKVYRPDWSRPERKEYTKRLASLLDLWLPAGQDGSISTLPIGFKAGGGTPDGFEDVRQNLIDVLSHIDRLNQKSGRKIILALEPEPGCVLETTSDAIAFIEQMRFPSALADGIGVCFDCCHQAVQFETPEESLLQLNRAGIRVPKIQISSALRIRENNFETLKRFIEPSYLHQTANRRKDGTIRYYTDLPEALDQGPQAADDEWRIHFHVPVFIGKMGKYETTRSFTEAIIAMADPNILLEIETYTWHVLPTELQTKSVTESIIREIQWVKSKLDEKNRRS